MRIVVPANFRDARQLRDRESGLDPRSVSFSEQFLEIDMRHCTFIHAPALLWCLTYPLVAQLRSEVLVRLPRDGSVLRWLTSLGLPAILTDAGVRIEVAEHVTVFENPQVVIPLTRFDNSDAAEDLTGVVFDSLVKHDLGAANVRPVVSWLFSEIAQNAVQHSGSRVASYGYVQYYEKGTRGSFVCGVADGGIGIRESLRRNPELRYIRTDAHAIDKALEKRVTGTLVTSRGMGLPMVRHAVEPSGGQLTIHSASGAIAVNPNVHAPASFAHVFPGTAVCAWLPT